MVKRIVLILVGITTTIVATEIILIFAGITYNLVNKGNVNDNSSADYRIFCIGESTTWGIGAKDPSTQSYPKQLERMLSNKFPDKTIKIFYDQTIGQNTSEILLKLPLYIRKYNPSLIIIMAGVKDWWNLDKNNFLLFNKNENISNFTLKMLIFLDRFRVWKLFKWVKLSLGLYRERWNYWFPKEETPSSLGDKLMRRYGESYFKIINKITEHNLREIIKVCKKNNIDIILCTYPCDVTANLYYIIKQLGKNQRIYFVDNYAYFRSLHQDEIKDYLWKDGWHPNEKGYRIVADNILKCIVRNHLIR